MPSSSFISSSGQDLDDEGDALGEGNVAALVARATAGDTEAFGQIYDLFLDRVYRYVYYRLGNVGDAEDITEQVFLNAWQAVRRYRDKGSPFIAWLLRIAQNAIIDYRRTRKQNSALDEGTVDQALWADPVAVADLRCTQGELRRAILRLKPEQQQVIIMRLIDDLSYAEVAAALGKSEGAVRVIQHRALAALREALMKETR